MRVQFCEKLEKGTEVQGVATSALIFFYHQVINVSQPNTK